MKRDDFVFTVGFQGETAIVDRKAQRRHRGSTVDQLISAGLFGPAFRAALFDDDDDAVERVRLAYNQSENADYDSRQALGRLFGVDSVPDEVSKVRSL